MQHNSLKAPVLFIIFNRPDTTEKVFQAIGTARPGKLYIFADGPRMDHPDDARLCSETRKKIEAIDWPCEISLELSPVNLGCGPAIYKAITWVFEKEDRVIVLEDDCLPAEAFFRYCDELLEKYSQDTRVWMISGNNFNEELVTTPHSYFFSRYCHIWGWATWKRSWKTMDLELTGWPGFRDQGLMQSAFPGKKEVRKFEALFNKYYHSKSLQKSTWDLQFFFNVRVNGGLSIVPRRNLVSNIGFTGTHTAGHSRHHNLPVDEHFKIVSHPGFVICDESFDRNHFEKHWRPMLRDNLILRLLSRLKRLYYGLKN